MKAFRDMGHEAFSCDIQECSGGYPEFHLQMDAIEALKIKKWDLMIGHPPCTYLCTAGFHYSLKRPERMELTIQAHDFFMALMGSDIEYIALENPVGIMSTRFRKPDQIIEPFQFGHPERKKTCLWLKNLPVLEHTSNLEVKPLKTIIRKSGRLMGKPYNYYWRQGKSAKERSVTFQGIAEAMASQWSEYIIKSKV